MAGYLIPLISKRLVDFSTLAIGNSQTSVLADRVDTLHWREVTLRVRVHQHTLATASGTIIIGVLPQSWTSEEPNMAFLGPPVRESLIDSGTPSPAFMVGDVPTFGDRAVLGPLARIVAVGQRTQVGALRAILSLDFVVKDA